MNERFIPATMARSIGHGIFFRPIRSWHSATYAGEGLAYIPGSNDRSGCIRNVHSLIKECPAPHTVTHRLYWHERDQTKTISAFLSYPNAMGACNEYFWETYGLISDEGDISRYTGDNAEVEMEDAIIKHFEATNAL